MTDIKTERLQLLALTKPQLIAYADNPVSLAKGLGLEEEPLIIDPTFWVEVPDAIEKICIPGVENHPAEFAWFTHWVMILKAEKRLVGGIGLSGLPDEKGTVFIGYYVDERLAGKGLATEATAGMISWAMENPNVQAIMADTLVDGFASQRVLQKCGFVLLKKMDSGELRWELSKKN